jgi:hypothetical protein
MMRWNDRRAYEFFMFFPVLAVLEMPRRGQTPLLPPAGLPCHPGSEKLSLLRAAHVGSSLCLAPTRSMMLKIALHYRRFAGVKPSKMRYLSDDRAVPRKTVQILRRRFAGGVDRR